MSTPAPTKFFRLFVLGTDEDVFGGEISEGNAYICAYPKVTGRPVLSLEVGESTSATYALSGQKPTTYTITRTR